MPVKIENGFSISHVAEITWNSVFSKVMRRKIKNIFSWFRGLDRKCCISSFNI